MTLPEPPEPEKVLAEALADQWETLADRVMDRAMAGDPAAAMAAAKVYRSCAESLRAALAPDPGAAPEGEGLVLVRKNSGGVFPDGTTNHPPIDFAPDPGAAPEVEGLWEAFIVDTEPDGWPQAQKRLRAGVRKHRPLIEAALRDTAPALDATSQSDKHPDPGAAPEVEHCAGCSGWVSHGPNDEGVECHGIEAALRDTAPALDVERLARALASSLIYFDPKVTLADCAVRIAEEYARDT